MDNKKIFDDFHSRRAKSASVTGIGKWEYYLIKSILKYVDKKNLDNILEVGCGRGNKTVILSEYFDESKIIGIDFSNSGIEVAKKNYSSHSNLEFVNSELNNFIENSTIKKFDMLVMFEVLEHVEDWQNLLKNVIDISNKYILLSFPTGRMREFEKYIGHFRNFKKGEVENFLKEHNFKIIKTYYAGFPFYSPIARDYGDRNYKKIIENIDKEFTIFQKLFHYLIYILLRYFSLKNVGDAFYGLFERVNKE